MRYLSVFIAVALALNAPVAGAKALSGKEAAAALDAAFAERARGNIDGVIPLLDPVIASLEEMETSQGVVCGENMPQTLAVMVTPMAHPNATTPNKIIAADPAFCDALFLKGFVLIDVGRPAEAEPFLRRATEHAPYNGHYANEYAEWYKSTGQWARAHELFAHALDLADMAPNDSEKVKRKARALRGLGFTEIEMGKLDEAGQHMRESLKVEPDNKAPLGELEYIARLRRQSTH